MNYKKEIAIRTIKLIDIGFITSIYLVLGIVLAKLCDIYLGDFDENAENKKPRWICISELILYFWFLGIIIYIIRNIVPLIPFPMNGIYGFKHEKVKELSGDTTFAVAFVYFQNYYQKKLQNILSRLKN